MDESSISNESTIVHTPRSDSIALAEEGSTVSDDEEISFIDSMGVLGDHDVDKVEVRSGVGNSPDSKNLSSETRICAQDEQPAQASYAQRSIEELKHRLVALRFRLSTAVKRTRSRSGGMLSPFSEREDSFGVFLAGILADLADEIAIFDFDRLSEPHELFSIVLLGAGCAI